MERAALVELGRPHAMPRLVLRRREAEARAEAELDVAQPLERIDRGLGVEV